jgi:hypothetical protein
VGSLFVASLAVTPGIASAHTPVMQASKAPGALIAAQAVSAPGINGTAYSVEYWSESAPKNRPVKVSGLVVVPLGTPPVGGWPVVSWAHPTDGMTGNCAPSLTPQTDVPYANNLLAQGWEITATDYVNEVASAPTSQKLLPYMVGTEAARNAIDIVRAAINMGSLANASSRYQAWGWSEGADTALWVSNIASSYAPELTMVGSVATAFGAPFESLYQNLQSQSEWWPLDLMMIEGLKSDYGGKAAPIGEVLTKLGKSLAASLKSEPQCISGIVTSLSGEHTASQVFLSSSLPAPWQTLFAENDPGNFTVAGPAPILIVQGDADTLVDPSLSANLATKLCSLGQPQQLQRWLYSGLTHFTAMGNEESMNTNGNGDGTWGASSTIGDVVAWMANRFGGVSWPDPYMPTGAGVTPVTQTNSCG